MRIVSGEEGAQRQMQVEEEIKRDGSEMDLDTDIVGITRDHDHDHDQGTEHADADQGVGKFDTTNIGDIVHERDHELKTDIGGVDHLESVANGEDEHYTQ